VVLVVRELKDMLEADDGEDQCQTGGHVHQSVEQTRVEEEQWAQSEQCECVRGEDDVGVVGDAQHGWDRTGGNKGSLLPIVRSARNSGVTIRRPSRRVMIPPFVVAVISGEGALGEPDDEVVLDLGILVAVAKELTRCGDERGAEDQERDWISSRSAALTTPRARAISGPIH
jgi:hypothetical protein